MKREREYDKEREREREREREKERESKEKLMENMYMPPIAHGQNDVQTILRGTPVPHALRPYDTIILHLNTNNVCFYSAFDFRTRMYECAYKYVIEMQERGYVGR